MRQFLAIPIPEEALAIFERIPQFMRDTGSWRFVRRSGIHLTLRFLGEVTEERDAQSRAAWNSAVMPVESFRLTTGGLDAFPSRRRARALVVDVKEVGSRTHLIGLARRLEEAARSAGFEAEQRPFRPHLTVARCPRGSHPRFPDPEPRLKRVAFTVDRVHLYRSDLTPGGARYTVLDSFRLVGGARV